MAKTIEKKTADALLQKKVEITINGNTYFAEQPTIATLVLASEKISEMPSVEMDKENVLNETIAIAPQCKQIAEIIAILIIGAKALKTQKNSLKSKILGLIGLTEKSEYEKLVDELYFNATPSQLNKALAELIMTMEIGDFFGLTTTLLGINLTREKMKTKAIAFGR